MHQVEQRGGPTVDEINRRTQSVRWVRKGLAQDRETGSRLGRDVYTPSCGSSIRLLPTGFRELEYADIKSLIKRRR